MVNQHHGFADVAHQAWMVLDRVRTDAYWRAIQDVVRPDDVVLDIGSGSGLLALFAAKAGARRVYAVERTGIAQTAREHVRDNGFDDVIEVLRTDFMKLESLPEPPTVVLGEVLGHFPPEEQIHALYAKAKALAAPGARFIPERYQLLLAPARPKAMQDELASLKNIHGISLNAMVSRLRKRLTALRVGAHDRLGPWVGGAWYDVADPLPAAFRGICCCEQSGELTAIAVAFRARLSDAALLDTSQEEVPTHWLHTLLGVDPPVALVEGDEVQVDLRPRVVNQRSTYRWTVVVGPERREIDGLDALSGDKDDFAAFFGLTPRAPERDLAAGVLPQWAAALGGEVPSSLEAMTDRIMNLYPDRYPDASAARQEAMALILSAWRSGR